MFNIELDLPRFDPSPDPEPTTVRSQALEVAGYPQDSTYTYVSLVSKILSETINDFLSWCGLPESIIKVTFER